MSEIVRQVTKPGIYRMASADYHADPTPVPSLSSHVAAALVDKTPRHAWALHPRLNSFFQREQKREYDRGSAAHAHLLRSGDEDGIQVFDVDNWNKHDDRRARDLVYERGGIPLLSKQWVEVQRMVEFARIQIRASEWARAFRYGVSERVIVWVENTPAGDVWCRIMVDRLFQGGAVDLDYKTTDGSAAPEVWGNRGLWTIDADMQEAFYRRGLKAAFGRDHTFVFMVQEVAFPYCMSFIALDPAAQKEGDEKAEAAIRLWGEHMAAGDWPGYPGKTAYVGKPSFRTYDWEEKKAGRELSDMAKARAIEMQAPLEERFRG